MTKQEILEWIQTDWMCYLAPFCLRKGKATVWSRETGGAEKQTIEL